jgi:hypothetical protein
MDDLERELSRLLEEAAARAVAALAAAFEWKA